MSFGSLGIDPEKKDMPRKQKICPFCRYYNPPYRSAYTENVMEGECQIDEDIDETEKCEYYEHTA